MNYLFASILLLFALVSCGQKEVDTPKKFSYQLSDAQWQQKLSSEQYRVLIKNETEPAFSGASWNNKKKGTYSCAGCGQALFLSETKFESGTGWPSFFNFIDDNVGIGSDYDLGYLRNEVHCAKCGGHLGHVFKDGPEPTGLRYCINSAALNFKGVK